MGRAFAAMVDSALGRRGGIRIGPWSKAKSRGIHRSHSGRSAFRTVPDLFDISKEQGYGRYVRHSDGFVYCRKELT